MAHSCSCVSGSFIPAVTQSSLTARTAAHYTPLPFRENALLPGSSEWGWRFAGSDGECCDAINNAINTSKFCEEFFAGRGCRGAAAAWRRPTVAHRIFDAGLSAMGVDENSRLRRGPWIRGD